MRATIKMIAERAGVSIGTVDRVLHDRPYVKEEVRRRVLEVMEELDYQPNRVASALATSGMARHFAIIQPTWESYVGEAMAAGVAKFRQDRQDYNVSVTIHPYRQGRMEDCLHLLDTLAEEVQGIALCAADCPQVRQKLELLAERRMPVVTFNSDIAGARRLCYVGEDAHHAGRVAGDIAAKFLRPATTGRMKDRKDADAIANACKGKAVTVKSVERKEKSEKAPALYDLTSLQRDANRVLGYTSQQTLDYLQALYEKKLCTYPRTDSRFLTDDMEGSVPGLVAAAAAVCGMEKPPTICAKQVCSSKKVTDHHAIVPTISAEKVDIASLPLGEREVLKLAARGLLRAVDEPHRYAETVITVDCAGQSFTAKGKTVLAPGWKRYEQEQAEAAPALPVVTEQQTLSVSAASVKTGKTTPPKHFTEDTLLAAMENAGKEDMPDDAERKGIGTPATRSGIIEKLVSSGFVERRKSKKITNLLPTSTGTALITVLPEQLQSPQLTAEWEHRLKEIERGEIAPDSFMDGIAAMLHELVQTYKPIPGTEVLFPSGREAVGQCPRCGAEVTGSPKGFFCENRTCSFVLWKNSRFFTAKKKALTKSLAAALLKNGRAPLKGCYSEKTGKTYDAVVLLEDDGQHTGYKLVFDNG